jgi:hypothetical protein
MTIFVPPGILQVEDGAGPITSPTDISGCITWLDGTDMGSMYQDELKATPVTATGQDVGAWEDKSGQGNDWTQSVAADRPTYVAGDRLQFFEDFLWGPDFSSLTAGSIFFRLQTNAHTGLSGLMHIGEAGGTSSAAHYYYLERHYCSFGCTTRRREDGFWSVNEDLALHVINSTAGAGEHKVYKNNVIGIDRAATISFNDQCIIGSTVRNQVYDDAYHYDGWLHSVVMYNAVLSANNRLRVFNYMDAIT